MPQIRRGPSKDGPLFYFCHPACTASRDYLIRGGSVRFARLRRLPWRLVAQGDFTLTDNRVEPFLMGKREGGELDANAVTA